MRAPAATALADTAPRRLDALLGRACARFADRVALDDGEDVLDYRTLGERGRAIAAALTRAGHRRGEPVLVAVDNRCGDLVCELGAWAAGAVVVPVHRDSPALVLRSTAERVGARLLLGDPRHRPAAWEDATGQAGHPWIGGIVPDAGAGAGPRGGALPRVPAELDADQALVVFTSGSTGRPKGVVLSHRVLHTKLRAISSTLPFEEGHSALHLLHLNFSFGQWTSLLTLATGGTLLLTPRFRAREVLDRLAERPVERTAVVPSMLRLIRRELDGSPDAAALLRRLAEVGSPGTWICGGEPLPAGLGRGIRALLPHAGIADVFGLSESATSDFILTPDRYDDEAGTIGRPSPGVEYRIVPPGGAAGTGPDAASAAGPDNGAGGTAAGPGVAGELWLRTDHLMTGYLDDVAATAATMAGPWLRTGDLARHRPQDGLVELVGRAKQLIVRGGAKISPLEVEDAYADHPDCAAGVAVRVPDALLGERLHLLFVPRAGRTPTEEELRAHGLRRLEAHKVPERVHLIDEPPLGRTGKTDRAAAARIAAARAAAAPPAPDAAPRGAA